MRWRFGMALGAMAVGLCAASGAQAALQTLTVNFDQYASAVDSTPNQILATMTVKDLASGGVSVDVSLDKAIYFASTGGPHITLAFNLDKAIGDLTFATPLLTGLFPATKFVTNKDAGSTFGTFTAGIGGNWSGTSNHFGGPIDFTIAGVQVSDFEKNAKGYWAIADLLGTKGTGEAGGALGTITTIATTSSSPVPEPSTWAMMLVGFVGLGYAAIRRGKGAKLSRAMA